MITYIHNNSIHNNSNNGEFIIDCQNDAQEELKALIELMRTLPTLPERGFEIEGHFFFRCYMPGFTIKTNKGEVYTFFERDGDEGNEYKLYTQFRSAGYYDYLRRPYCRMDEFTINNLKKIEGYIEKELNEAEKIFTKAMYNGMDIRRGTNSWANIVKWSEKS